jgi:hypothetical protein
MIRTCTAIFVTIVGCSAFDGFEPQYQLPPTWGLCSLRVTTTGGNPSERYDYLVSLDSAIQGYGARSITTSSDTVVFEPIPAGQHVLTLRGVKANCTVQGGTERPFLMTAGAALFFRYDVTCAAAP